MSLLKYFTKKRKPTDDKSPGRVKGPSLGVMVNATVLNIKPMPVVSGRSTARDELTAYRAGKTKFELLF